MYSTQLLSTLWNWSQQLLSIIVVAIIYIIIGLYLLIFIEWLVVGIYWFYSLSIMYWYPIAASGYLHKKMVSYSSNPLWKFLSLLASIVFFLICFFLALMIVMEVGVFFLYIIGHLFGVEALDTTSIIMYWWSLMMEKLL
jgi:hypothetical protein